MKAFVILSHSLTDKQVEDLRNMGYADIREMDSELKKVWSSIPPEYEGAMLIDHLQPILNWVTEQANHGDIVIIQGEPASTCYLVRLFKQLGLRCYAATTKRMVKEKVMDNGEVVKVSVFEHVKFRPYL